MSKIKLKSGDQVKVIAGKFRGTISKIQQVKPTEQILFLSKVTREKSDKKKQKKTIFIPVHFSNVTIWPPK